MKRRNSLRNNVFPWKNVSWISVFHDGDLSGDCWSPNISKFQSVFLLQPMEKANYILLPARLRWEEYLLCFDGSCTWPEFQVGGGWRAANQVLNPPSLPPSSSLSSSSSSIIIIIIFIVESRQPKVLNLPRSSWLPRLFPPWWGFVHDYNGGNLSSDKILTLGKDGTTKSDKFLETFQGGGGNFNPKI